MVTDRYKVHTMKVNVVLILTLVQVYLTAKDFFSVGRLPGYLQWKRVSEFLPFEDRVEIPFPDPVPSTLFRRRRTDIDWVFTFTRRSRLTQDFLPVVKN